MLEFAHPYEWKLLPDTLMVNLAKTGFHTKMRISSTLLFAAAVVAEAISFASSAPRFAHGVTGGGDAALSFDRAARL